MRLTYFAVKGPKAKENFEHFFLLTQKTLKIKIDMVVLNQEINM